MFNYIICDRSLVHPHTLTIQSECLLVAIRAPNRKAALNSYLASLGDDAPTDTDSLKAILVTSLLEVQSKAVLDKISSLLKSID